ncbi:DUF1003 domain-containing protein [Patescibacteria group bacterium]|nr:DUF1003 domain-containing protein [Patescibacteria group bacterium]MBU1895436.1 DUF1003 domain-containing protein [Patescibacteria group bacterium]
MKKNTPNNKTVEHPSILRRSNMTHGQRAADHMTGFLGSWKFIIIFFLFLLIWMAINVIAFELRWDPYPFILLNLMLSCLAAIQAPIIMMSQNRQAERDRISAKYDYAVNRKAERGIQDVQKELRNIKKSLDEINKK